MNQFYEACENSNLLLVNKFISEGAFDLNLGLHYACKGCNINIIELIISKGANDWNAGLCSACLGGHMNIMDLMISKGADYDFDNKYYNKNYNDYLLNKTVTKKYILTLNMPLDILRIIVAYL